MSAKPNPHSLITAAARDDHGRPMLRASCSCGWVSGNRWYHEMFVVQDHEAHVRQEGK